MRIIDNNFQAHILAEKFMQGIDTFLSTFESESIEENDGKFR